MVAVAIDLSGDLGLALLCLVAAALVLGAISAAVSAIALKRTGRTARALAAWNRSVILLAQRLNAMTEGTQHGHDPKGSAQQQAARSARAAQLDGSDEPRSPARQVEAPLGLLPPLMPAEQPPRSGARNDAVASPNGGFRPPESMVHVLGPERMNSTVPDPDRADDDLVRPSSLLTAGGNPESDKVPAAPVADPDETIRLRRVRALRDAGHANARHILLDALSYDPSPSVRAEAATALGSLLHSATSRSAGRTIH